MWTSWVPVCDLVYISAIWWQWHITSEVLASFDHSGGLLTAHCIDIVLTVFTASFALVTMVNLWPYVMFILYWLCSGAAHSSCNTRCLWMYVCWLPWAALSRRVSPCQSSLSLCYCCTLSAAGLVDFRPVELFFSVQIDLVFYSAVNYLQNMIHNNLVSAELQTVDSCYSLLQLM